MVAAKKRPIAENDTEQSVAGAKMKPKFRGEIASSANASQEAELTRGIGSPEISDELDSANWLYWRERGFVRLWQAAMLSLNYEPNIANRDVLREKNDEDHKIYLRRMRALEMLYGYHPFLPPFKHRRNGEAIRNRYVSWDNLVLLAIEKKWGNFSHHADEADVAARRTPIDSVDETDDQADVYEKNSKTDKAFENSRNIALGALLDVFERSLRGESLAIEDGKDRKKMLVKGKEANLNHSDLAKLIIQAIGTRAEKQSGYGFQNIHKQLTTASNAFRKSTSARA